MGMTRIPISTEKAKAPRRGRPPKIRENKESRDHILDVAEALFAEHGLHGVTLREVAKGAEVDTALVHYYFGTKQGLFDAVFLRRADVVNKDRMDSMAAYEAAAGDRLTVEGCIESWLAPILEYSLNGGPGWKNYFRLLALVNNTPAWGGQTMTKYFDPVIHRLIDLLRKAMPEADDAHLYWCYHFVTGALTLSLSETGRIDRLSEGLCASDDIEEIHRRMVPFVAAGFRNGPPSRPS